MGEDAGSPPAKRPRLDYDEGRNRDADEAERKKRERAEKFRLLRDAKKRKEADAPTASSTTTNAANTTTAPSQAPPAPTSRPIVAAVNTPAVAPKVVARKPFSRISVNLRMDTGSPPPDAAAPPTCREAFSAQEALFQELLPPAAPAQSSSSHSSTAPAAESDSLDEYMQQVDKKYRADVVDTLERMARTQRREERSAAATEAARANALPKQSITLDEILEQGGGTESESQEVDMSSFMSALRQHEQKKLGDTAATPPPGHNLQLAIRAEDKPKKEIGEPYSPTEDGGSDEEDNPHNPTGGNDSILLGVDDDENQQGAIDDFLSAPGQHEPDYFELLAQHGSKKELQPVDHSKVEYEPFKKNLYIQVREITQMKDHEVEALRRTNGNIRVRGKGCPRPIKEFSQCGLKDALLQVLIKRGCDVPFPIQMQAIPALMAGRNVIGVAETGSGKTLAYLLPLLRHVLAQRPLAEGEGPIGLIITPTRELAQQIAQEAKRYCNAVKLRCALVYGGGGIGAQLSELKRGAEIVVGTPGRLTEVLTINRGRICNLRRVTFLVLDEADRMFDLGFGPQVERIMGNVQPDAQKAMFSATFPAHIEVLARNCMYKPLEIIVGEKGRAASTVTQYVEVLPDKEAKFLRLLKILGEWYDHGESILIFARCQVEVDELAIHLGKFGYDCLVLHSRQDQEDRDLALDDFKHKRKTILVATSVASRGLDVRSVVLVVNYTPPDHIEDYVHRIGRTGRAGNIGVAYTFFTPDEADKAFDIERALSESGQKVPEALHNLVEEYQAQVQGGVVRPRKVKGFGGRGYKFTAAERSAQQEAKQYWKKELGIGEEQVEEENADGDAGGSSEAAATGASSAAGPSAAGGGGVTIPLRPSAPPPPSGGNTPVAAPVTPSGGAAGPGNIQPNIWEEINAQAVALVNNWTAAILDPAQKAQQVESLVPAIRQIIAQRHSLPVGGMPPVAPNGRPMPNVSQMVQDAIQPLKAGGPPKGAVRPVSQAEYIDPVTNNFVTSISINDYPAQARHKVSQKETLNRISESTGAALQVRGVYIDPDRRRLAPIQIGAKELHIEIIAPTQVAAQRAKRELHSILETVAKKQLNAPSNGRW